MITRAQMPRQLRDRGGIMTIKTVRQKYGVGDFVRKLIPNELARVAEVAAPIIAIANPALAPFAAVAGGLGRYDRTGDLKSSALYGGGIQFAGAASPGFESLGTKGATTFGSGITKNILLGKEGGTSLFKDKGLFGAAGEFGLKEAIGGGKPGIFLGTTALSLLGQKLVGPKKEDESEEEYLERRKTAVSNYLRRYYSNLNPTAPATDVEAFVQRNTVDYKAEGGIARLGYQAGDLVDPRMRQSLAQNIAVNEANRKRNRAKRQQAISKIFPKGDFENIRATSPTRRDYNIKSTEDLVRNLPGGIIRDIGAPAAALAISVPYDRMQAATRTTQSDIDRAIQSGALTPREIADEAFGLAYERENPLSTAIERTIGAAGPLAERLSQGERLIPGFTKVGDRSYQGPDGQIYGPETYASIAAGRYPDIYDPRKDAAKGGRIGFAEGDPLPNKEMAGYGYNEAMSDTFDMYNDMKKNGLIPPTMTFDEFLQEVVPEMGSKKIREQRTMVDKGGIMDVPVRTNSEGIKELDYRKTGGFVPIGVKEKADDVPAMLSLNEFVMTADAVRGAGDGSIEKGAQRMYDTMKKLESRVG